MKFWTVLGGILLAVLLTVLVAVVVYNNVPAVKDWVDGWSTTQEQQPTEDENITPEVPDVNEDENQGPETNLQFFVFENDFAKILISA